MENNVLIDKLISIDRFTPYLIHNQYISENAMRHYKSNIKISEAFYPLLSILEIGLRNSIDLQLTLRFNDENWFDNVEFMSISSKFQKDKINDAKINILANKRELTKSRIISELTFGFWTSFFDAKFELNLWKNLRHIFPHCPKEKRKRKTISTKFNSIRKLRNRIFHYEAICWNFIVLENYVFEIMETLNWMNSEFEDWMKDVNRIENVLQENKLNILH